MYFTLIRVYPKSSISTTYYSSFLFSFASLSFFLFVVFFLLSPFSLLLTFFLRSFIFATIVLLILLDFAILPFFFFFFFFYLSSVGSIFFLLRPGREKEGKETVQQKCYCHRSDAFPLKNVRDFYEIFPLYANFGAAWWHSGMAVKGKLQSSEIKGERRRR